MSTPGRPLVAYFSMEYGLHEEFHSYAGGLGVLAGDFMKSAGDLGLPVVGIGLRWAEGYTLQRIGPDGYPVDEWREQTSDFLTDTEARVRVRVAGREVECRIWRVGRYAIAPLFLLEPTDPRDHWITRRLYDTRPDCRVAQEMLLGIGGVRALRALHLPVDLYHFNEGHAVYAGLELIAHRMEAGMAFGEAWRAARQSIVFTTHTPVPAGNEVHSIADLRRLGASCELVRGELAEIGGDPFNMTVAGLRLARAANAVAQLHGETARRMWAHVEGRAPIIAITNGVHAGTWQDARIPPALESGPALRAVRRTLKDELFAEVERRTGLRLHRNALTIGFARRAATYKRADLLLRDPGRLAPLLDDHRLQLIFAGKAHPADQEGKAVIALLVETIAQWPGSIVFLENYDMQLGRLLTRGADVWLNTPRRPMEASGTSGMKAAMNGVLNLSVLDGWWPEGCEHGVTGWAIGDEQEGGLDQDARDLRALYETLEGEVLPAFDDEEHWTRMMQASIRMAAGRFSSDRMVREYFSRLYVPAEVTEPAER
jgi:glycogen phosphorylase